MPSTEAPDAETAASERVVLDPSTRRAVVREYAPLAERNEVRGWQVEVVTEVYGRLMRSPGMHGIHDLHPHFDSFGTSEPKQGIFASPDRWWAELGREQLLALPGTATDETGRVEFAGIPIEDIEGVRGVGEDTETESLDEYRERPRTRILRALDGAFDPFEERYSEVLDLADAVLTADDGELTADEIGGDWKLPDLDLGRADHLAGLPCIEREERSVSPADLTIGEGQDIETLGDLREAMEAVEAPPEVVYRFDPAAEPWREYR